MRPEHAVLDASVFVRAQRREEPALRWIEAAWDRRLILVAPELIMAEVANAFLGYVRHGELLVDDAREALADLRSIARPVPLDRLFPEAFDVAFERGLSAYDATYVVAAEHGGVPLVTFDRKLAAATPNAVLVT